MTLHHAGSSVDSSFLDIFPAPCNGGQTLTVGQVGVVSAGLFSSCPELLLSWMSQSGAQALISPGKKAKCSHSPTPMQRVSDGNSKGKSISHQTPKTPLLGLLNDTLESSATLAPERDCPSPTSPCPTPPSTPPPSPPPVPALPQNLPLPAVCRAGEDGERGEEERAHSSNSPADPYCRVMGLLGMGHRLFVPKLLAVSNGAGT